MPEVYVLSTKQYVPGLRDRYRELVAATFVICQPNLSLACCGAASFRDRHYPQLHKVLLV
ncbi:MAG: hypothetical protein WB801_03605 [Candidatus Dormiibacterota bacterium]